MNNVAFLAGIGIGAVLTAGVAQLQAQAPAPATTRPAVFVITEQTFIDEKKYMDEFAGKAVETIKAAGGRFIVRSDQITKLSGDSPNRFVITGIIFHELKHTYYHGVKGFDTKGHELEVFGREIEVFGNYKNDIGGIYRSYKKAESATLFDGIKL